MLKNFHIGAQVKWIDHPWKGIIKAINRDRILVLLEDGFEEWELSTKLLLDIVNPDFEDIHDSKNELRHVESRLIKSSEIDLHIENLFVQWQKIPSEKILEYQIQAFREEFQQCVQNKIDELIVIHGKGSGILRDHLTHFLKTYTKLTFSHMNAGKYKNSAIKIYFHRGL